LQSFELINRKNSGDGSKGNNEMTDFQLAEREREREREMSAVGVKQLKIDKDFLQKKSVSAGNLEVRDCR